MKVFVGFGYNQRDAWIKELIFPLIKFFDGEILTGEDIYGEVLTDGVRNKIDEWLVVTLFVLMMHIVE